MPECPQARCVRSVSDHGGRSRPTLAEYDLYEGHVERAVPMLAESTRIYQELGDPFRRDALKYPNRVLDKYKHTNVKAPA